MSEESIIFGGNIAGMPVSKYNNITGGASDVYNREERLDGLVVPIGLIQYNQLNGREPIVQYKQIKEIGVINDDLFDALFDGVKHNKKSHNKTEKKKSVTTKQSRKVK
jgi:hypothetical protein